MLWVVAGVVISAQARAEGRSEEKSMPDKTIEAVLRQHAGRLMSLPGVVGIAQGLCDGKTCVKVFVAKKTGDVLKAIPASVEGYPVVVEETGEFRPFAPPRR